ISVTPDAPEGLLNAPVRVTTGVAQQPTLEVPVSGIVRPRVSVSPITVNFGNFTAGKDPITRNIVVTNNKPGTPVKVTKAEVSVPAFQTDVVPTQEGVSYTAVVKASDKVKKGAVYGMTTPHTSDREKAVIEIPLKGEALSGQPSRIESSNAPGNRGVFVFWGNPLGSLSSRAQRGIPYFMSGDGNRARDPSSLRSSG